MKWLDNLLGNYKHNVPIFKIRGDGVPMLVNDRAMKIVNKKEGIEKYKLYKTDGEFPSPRGHELLMTEKGRDVILKVQLDDGTFAPVIFELREQPGPPTYVDKIVIDPKTRKKSIVKEEIPTKEKIGVLKTGTSKDVQFWGIQERRRLAETFGKQTWLEKYAPLLMVFFSVIGLTFVAIYAFNSIEKVTGMIADMAKVVADANVKVSANFATIGQSIQTSSTVPVSGPPIR